MLKKVGIVVGCVLLIVATLFIVIVMSKIIGAVWAVK